MSAADCSVFDAEGDWEGKGDAMVDCASVTGIVSPGTEGVVVQPRLNTNETSTRETQRLLMNNNDLDILIHLF
jgi:hypothetical protein